VSPSKASSKPLLTSTLPVLVALVSAVVAGSILKPAAKQPGEKSSAGPAVSVEILDSRSGDRPAAFQDQFPLAKAEPAGLWVRLQERVDGHRHRSPDKADRVHGIDSKSGIRYAVMDSTGRLWAKQVFIRQDGLGYVLVRRGYHETLPLRLLAMHNSVILHEWHLPELKRADPAQTAVAKTNFRQVSFSAHISKEGRLVVTASNLEPQSRLKVRPLAVTHTLLPHAKTVEMQQGRSTSMYVDAPVGRVYDNRTVHFDVRDITSGQRSTLTLPIAPSTGPTPDVQGRKAMRTPQALPSARALPVNLE
jgi:hypothetical protein